MTERELSEVESGADVPRASTSFSGISVASAAPWMLERLQPALHELVAELERSFRTRRDEILRDRSRFRQHILSGGVPDFPEESRAIRRADWTIAGPPAALRDRRVEITGPTDRKMVVNALNSGASVYMADFEDAHAPVWGQTLQGQANLFDAVRRKIEFVAADGRLYRLRGETAVLMVRPRGWHLDEPHVRVDGRGVSASLFDFGVYAYQNALELLRRGAGPYVYLPKLEHATEARLWNEVFEQTELALDLPHGSIRPTVLIETLPAAFEMDEILYELRDRVLGLNCGRWDYIFSFIKQFRDDARCIFPDRSQLTMDRPFLKAYGRLLVETCHRRGAHAIGGMAADVPAKNDPEANARALERVVEDKQREVRLGHDGTWVAHPALVPVARSVFDREMTGPNQIGRPPDERPVGRSDLLEMPGGVVTASGVNANVRVALRYLSHWLQGNGAVAIDHRMEDAATVEIARTQLWQWVRHSAPVSDGPALDVGLFRDILAEQEAQLLREVGRDRASQRAVKRASDLIDRVTADASLAEFITIPATELLASSLEGG